MGTAAHTVAEWFLTFIQVFGPGIALMFGLTALWPAIRGLHRAAHWAHTRRDIHRIEAHANHIPRQTRKEKP
ncbi:hypothetical protein ACF1AL_14660 [Streptomyces sp. NPDC014801]|uniref:hypothetical protein n=1 Tax=Streptomyces sp. NPDC014801 TaxID=3364916 RepID=UPI0036FCCC74